MAPPPLRRTSAPLRRPVAACSSPPTTSRFRPAWIQTANARCVSPSCGSIARRSRPRVSSPRISHPTSSSSTASNATGIRGASRSSTAGPPGRPCAWAACTGSGIPDVSAAVQQAPLEPRPSRPRGRRAPGPAGSTTPRTCTSGTSWAPTACGPPTSTPGAVPAKARSPST